ncbi:MAG: prepilin peptidase [Alphaproteobacteria bacterium]|nr:prepilin peptidase [Alphaproteobacteria bacterium]
MQAWAFAVALAVGSFLNVVIARMPEDRSVVSPPSHCPACGHQIRWYENIPVLSWLVLRARCSGCGTRISPLYPMIELLMGCLGLLLFRKLLPGPEAVSPDILWTGMAGWAVYLVFLAMLVAATYIDLRHYIIPDQLSIYAVPVGIGASAMLTALGYERALTWQQSVVGALVGGGVLLLVIGAYWLYKRQEGMGLGDVKLLAMIGAFLGTWPSLFVVVLISTLLGSVIGIGMIVAQGRSLRAQLPFGPFLSVAAMLYLFFGEEIVHRFLPGLVLYPALWS